MTDELSKPPRKGKRRLITPTSLTLVKEYILLNRGANNGQVMHATHVSMPTVTRARRELIQDGLVQPSRFDHTRRQPTFPDIIDVDTPLDPNDALKKRLEDFAGHSGEPHSPTEMRRRVSTIAREAALAQNPQLELAAIQNLARLDAQMGDKNALGPGPPLSRDDRISRLSVLLDVCGPSLVAESAGIAFKLDELTTLQAHLTLEMGRKALPDAPTQETQVQTAPSDGTADPSPIGVA